MNATTLEHLNRYRHALIGNQIRVTAHENCQLKNSSISIYLWLFGRFSLRFWFVPTKGHEKSQCIVWMFIISHLRHKHFRFTSIQRFCLDFSRLCYAIYQFVICEWLLKILPFEVHVFQFCQVNYRGHKMNDCFSFNLRKKEKKQQTWKWIEKRTRSYFEWIFVMLPVVPTLLFVLVDDGSSFLFLRNIFHIVMFHASNFRKKCIKRILLAGYALCVCVCVRPPIRSFSLIGSG